MPCIKHREITKMHRGCYLMESVSMTFPSKCLYNLIMQNLSDSIMRGTQKNRRIRQYISSWMITSLPEYGQTRISTRQCCNGLSMCCHQISVCIRIFQSRYRSITITVSTGSARTGRCMELMLFLRFAGAIGSRLNGALMENLHRVLLRSLLSGHRTAQKRNSGFWMAILRW